MKEREPHYRSSNELSIGFTFLHKMLSICAHLQHKLSSNDSSGNFQNFEYALSDDLVRNIVVSFLRSYLNSDFAVDT